MRRVEFQGQSEQNVMRSHLNKQPRHCCVHLGSLLLGGTGRMIPSAAQEKNTTLYLKKQ
jgi:hypothetical protein